MERCSSGNLSKLTGKRKDSEPDTESKSSPPRGTTFQDKVRVTFLELQ